MFFANLSLMTNTATLNTSNKNTVNYVGEKSDLKTKRKLRERENSNSKTLILKDSSIRSIWTYLTASPCERERQRERDRQTETLRERQIDRQTEKQREDSKIVRERGGGGGGERERLAENQ